MSRWMMKGKPLLTRSLDDGFDNSFGQVFHRRPPGHKVVGARESLGLFLNCKKPSGDQMALFFGECIPKLDTLEEQFYDEVKLLHQLKN